MKIVETKTSTKKLKSKKTSVDYSSWNPLTQAKYLFDLHQQLGHSPNLKKCYDVAAKATSSLD